MSIHGIHGRIEHITATSNMNLPYLLLIPLLDTHFLYILDFLFIWISYFWFIFTACLSWFLFIYFIYFSLFIPFLFPSFTFDLSLTFLAIFFLPLSFQFFNVYFLFSSYSNLSFISFSLISLISLFHFVYRHTSCANFIRHIEDCLEHCCWCRTHRYTWGTYVCTCVRVCMCVSTCASAYKDVFAHVQLFIYSC